MARKKSIAFVISSLKSGGAERVVSTLSNELAENFKVSIITFVAGEPFYKLVDEIEVIPCTEYIAPSTNSIQALRTNYRLFRDISKIIASRKIDLVIGFMTSVNIVTIFAALTKRIPVIISERNNPKVVQLQFIWKFLRKITYPKANFLIVQTSTIKEYYNAMVDESKLVILPNPLSPDLMRKTKSKCQKENIVLNVGRLTAQKGQDILIEAFSAIKPNGWQLIIVGEGEKREMYQKLIDDLKMSEAIKLVGRKKNIQDYYDKSKIFAFPSRFEGFPNALIEAMHWGLACVSTNCPTGPSELIENGQNGFLIDVDDGYALQKKLVTLMESEKTRKLFSTKAKKSTEDFEVKTVVKKWEKLIFKSLSDYKVK